ncbi:hypothetical protein PT974_10443 [Cladobotryum mycophilum]|uniref:CsbD-like domain-containing protein n=1 Tax=Cladobotryum mycophilum TaxID=491253 RepID=A0ABR0S9V5_9HYPO
MEDFKNQHRVGGVRDMPLNTDNAAPAGNTTYGGNAFMENSSAGQNTTGHDVGLGAASNTAQVPSTGAPSQGDYDNYGTNHGDTPSGTGTGIGNKIKGMAAQGHGLGEALRANVGAAVDTMAGDKEGQARNEEIARKGRYEINERQFAPKGNKGSDQRVL